jgi:adenylate cyclase
VIGETVNLASRIEGLCKTLGEPILFSDAMGRNLGAELRNIGTQAIRGVPDPIELFTPIRSTPENRRQQPSKAGVPT